MRQKKRRDASVWLCQTVAMLCLYSVVLVNCISHSAVVGPKDNIYCHSYLGISGKGKMHGEWIIR